MGVLRVTNNAWGNLSTAISAASSTMTLQSGQGARFPAIAVGSGDWFYIDILDTHGNKEEVQVTYALGDVFGIVRGVDGETALNWQAGVRVELRPTRAAWNDLQASFLYALGEGLTMTGMLTLAADPTTSSQAATKHYIDTNALPITQALQAPVAYKPVWDTSSSGRVQLGYASGSNFTLAHSGTTLGTLWTNLNFNPASIADLGATCPWGGGPYMAGEIATRNTATTDIGTPWIMEGMYQDGAGFNYYAFYPRWVWMKNQ